MIIILSIVNFIKFYFFKVAKSYIEQILGKKARVIITSEYSDNTNASFSISEGVFYVNNNATELSKEQVAKQVAIHEIVHYTEGTEQYYEMVDELAKVVEDSNAPVEVKKRIGDLSKRLEAIKKDYQGDTEGMNEALKQYVYQTEGVADLVGDLLADEQTITRLAQRNESFVKKLLTKIKALANKSAKVDSEATKYLNKLVKSFEKAIDNAHGGVSLNSIGSADEEKDGETAETGIRFSKKREEYPYSMQTVIQEYIESVDESILNVATEHRNNKNTPFVRQKICNVDVDFATEINDIFNINVEGFSFNINSNAFNHIEKRHGLNGEADKSMANLKDLARIGYVIENRDSIEPILKNGEPVYSKEFLTNEGNPAPLILLKKKINGTYYCTIAVTDGKYKKVWVQSAFINKRDGLTQILHDEISSLSFTSETVSASRPSNDIIPENGENVNRDERKSVQRSYNPSNEVDSEGSSLSEAQAEFFKDSKVRDKNGNLLVVYHGSQAQFTEFKHKYINLHGSQEGRGFYFTDKKSMAQGYEREGGQLLKGYLNITKPLSDTEFTLTRAEIKKLLKALDPTGDDIVINYDTEGGMGYPSQAWYNRAFNDALNAIMNYCNTDSEVLAEIRNSGADEETLLNTVRDVLGYDGYMVSDKYDGASVFVAFESNQFKNADNKAPTFNPDIRYSKKRSYTPEHQIEKYQKELDNWDRETIGFSFVIGEATEIISNIDIDGSKIGNKQIRIDAAKVKKILSEHQTMSIEVIKELPYLINDPILILDSLTQKGRIILLGEVYDEAGMPVMLILEPNPKTKNKKSTYVNVIKVASAYGKGKLQSLIERSNIKYISKNKSRANNWLKVNRLQLPFPNTQYGSATNSIDQNSQKINTFDENNLDERKSKKHSYNPTEDANFEDEGNVWVEDEQDGVKVILSTPDFNNPNYEKNHAPGYRLSDTYDGDNPNN